MESQSDVKSCCPSGGPCGVASNNKVYCKCGEGWSCVITTVDTGEPFYKCDESSCVCIMGDEGASITEKSKPLKQQVVETEGAYCVCGEGYACTITSTKGSGSGEVFCECGNGYTCGVDGQTVKVATA